MLALVAVGDAVSRSGHLHGGIPFWIGLALPFGIIVFRQASTDVARRERVALAVLAGLFLYMVKVLRDPFLFTFADELNQAHNTAAVVKTGALFAPNPLLPVTADYPGLASVTAAFASLTGLSIFGAGLVVVAAARTLMILGLFLLFERVTGSSRTAGLGALVYASAPNFLFFTAEVSYESLALPLAIAAIYAVTSWAADRSGRHIGWGLTALALIAAVVPTHHLTSYALIGILLGLSLTQWVTRKGRIPPARSAFPFACIALAFTTGWLVFVASRTVGYLEPVFIDAGRSTFTAIAREGAGTRKPFASSAGPAVPLWDRGLSLASTALILVLVLVGVYEVWRRQRKNPLALILAAAAIAYLATLALRLVPAAWEIANRSSEFLFVGVGLLLALAFARSGHGIIDRRVRRFGVALVATVIFAGGAAAGWLPEIRLGQALRVRAGDATIEPQGLTAARWSRAWLKRDARSAFAANGADSRLLLVYGGQTVRTGGIGGADQAIELPGLEQWQMQLLQGKSIRYVLMDRRKIADDQLSGYFFSTSISPPSWRTAISDEIYRKFDVPTTSRIFDSGSVAIYDVAQLLRARVHAPQRGAALHLPLDDVVSDMSATAVVQPPSESAS
jgi:hypothetical protein